ncbi:MAG: hypothetical protein Q7S40_34975 [Opitutaceae bacterium]|nr:hypothetical protein [Opitutaceae bacterium]
MISPENNERLERAIQQTLRQLPPRSAPRSLESRVLAEIERRAALPWWRKSFAHWPIAARAGFIVLSTGIVKLALMATVWVMAGFDPQQYRNAFAPQFAWMDRGLAVVGAITSSFEIILRNIPPLWLYGSIIFVGAMYVALFGLGAAAYRALRPQRSTSSLVSIS